MAKRNISCACWRPARSWLHRPVTGVAICDQYVVKFLCMFWWCLISYPTFLLPTYFSQTLVRKRSQLCVFCTFALSRTWTFLEALSWWIMRFWFCHFCGLLRRTFSCNLLRTSQLKSVLTVIPGGTNSRCAIPFCSKKQMSTVFNFLFCIRALLGLGDPGLFYCENCSFVSGS